jgi:hypothetical protein
MPLGRKFRHRTDRGGSARIRMVEREFCLKAKTENRKCQKEESTFESEWYNRIVPLQHGSPHHRYHASSSQSFCPAISASRSKVTVDIWGCLLNIDVLYPWGRCPRRSLDPQDPLDDVRCAEMGKQLPSQVRSAHDKIVSTLIAIPTTNRTPDGLIGPEFRSAICKLLIIGGHSRIRTYDFHRVKVALYR